MVHNVFAGPPGTLQLLGEREVRAVVKLKFKDITSTMVTCHRMLASIQKVCPQCYCNLAEEQLFTS